VSSAAAGREGPCIGGGGGGIAARSIPTCRRRSIRGLVSRRRRHSWGLVSRRRRLSRRGLVSRRRRHSCAQHPHLQEEERARPNECY